ncbi:MAG: hypothetical protein K8H88_32025 [Sandaracinaceae bacterium]|nr:hypothetical protein [Sandaracinaceae bacterium]
MPESSKKVSDFARLTASVEGPGRPLRCASACRLYLFCTVLAGCQAGPIEPADGGDGTELSVRVRGGEVESPWSLVSFEGALDELHVMNDRGGGLEPVWRDQPSRSLREELELRTDAVPATYGGVLVRVSGIDLALSRDARVIEIAGARIEADLRCESPIELAPSEHLALDLRLELGELVEALEGASLPDEGRIDEREPALLAAASDALAAGVELSCGEP